MICNRKMALSPFFSINGFIVKYIPNISFENETPVCSFCLQRGRTFSGAMDSWRVMLSSDRVDKMGVRTKIAVLTLVATWVLVQLCLYFHSYGYNYSEVRYENCEESVWDASSQEERILALDNSRKEQGMVHTLRGYWRDFVSLFGGAKPGGGESVLIDSGKVIIYAKYRTGSTFTSQFFFEHRNISYMFEPLRLEAHPDQPMVDDANGIIWDMLQCEFETNRTERILSWWMDRVVFCQITGQTPGCVHGKNVPLEKALRHCNKAGIQAVKVIRIQNIWQLEEFLQQQVKLWKHISVTVVGLTRNYEFYVP